MKRVAFLKHLHEQGCHLAREGAKHSWYEHAAKNTRSSVPRHTEIPDHLCRKICKDLRVTAPSR